MNIHTKLFELQNEQGQMLRAFTTRMLEQQFPGVYKQVSSLDVNIRWAIDNQHYLVRVK